MASIQRLRSLGLGLWSYVLALVCILVAGAVGRAIGGVAGVVVAVLCCLVLMVLLSLAGLIVSAWLKARRDRLERTRAPRGA